MKRLVLGILLSAVSIFSNAQTYLREANETTEAFSKRILKVKALAHPVIETKEWDSSNKVILSFVFSKQDTTAGNQDDEGSVIIGYAFIPVEANHYQQVLIDTFYENGGAPKIESVFFVNTDKDKQREIAVLVSTENIHRGAGVDGSFYDTYFYDNPDIQTAPARLKLYKTLSEKFSCFDGYKNNKTYKAKYKTAKSIKAALKRMGY